MAQTIKLKRSSTQGSSPSTSQLELGEVAINTYDGKMFIKKDDGTESIVEVGGDSDTNDYVDSLAFSTSTGVLTAGRTGSLSDLTVDLDGRYITGNQTITLSGDVSGSGTTSINVTVADDSHNHIISNVDGLQSALDAKLDSSSYTASDVFNKVKSLDGQYSGLDADRLDGQEGGYYWNIGNDGSGSGLDADTVDGIQASSFLRSDTSDTAFGSITFTAEQKFGASYSDPDSGVQRDAKFGTNGIAVSGGIKTDSLTTSGNISFGDSDKAVFGASSDLQIYHDGSNSFITDVGTGNLNIRASNILRLQSATEEKYLEATANGSVKLYHNNNTKLATTSTGIDVTGVITTDGMTTSADINFGDNDKAVFGAGNDLQIYHDGSNSYVSDQGQGELRLRGSSYVKITDTNDEVGLQFRTNGAVTLYHNNVAKFETTSTGIDVTGSVVADGLTVDGNAQVSNIGVGGAPNAHGIYVYHTDNYEAALFQTNLGGSLARFTDTTASIEIGVQGGKPVIRTGSAARLTVDGANVQINSGSLQMGSTTVIDSSRNLTNIGTLNGGTAWRSNNDGSGSGLDADTVDGIQGSSFLRSDADDTSTGSLTLRKNDGALFIQSQTNSPTNGAMVKFSDYQSGSYGQYGWIKYKHADGQVGTEPVTSNDGFIIGGTETNTLVNIHGHLNVQNDTNIDSNLYVDGMISMADKIEHTGDTDTYMQFHADNQWRVVAGGTERLEVNGGNVTVNANLFVSDQMRIGDDAWIEDFNVANAIRIKGNQSSSQGYIAFGNRSELLGQNNNGTLLFNNNVVWHAGNDGQYSGLDADRLDGQEGGYYWNAGNDGSGSGLDADTVDGYNTTTSGNRWGVIPTVGSDGVMEVGKYIDFHNSDGHTGDYAARLESINSNTIYLNGHKLWHSGNDGSGSGLDADTVDGQHESTFMRRSANSQLDMNNNDIIGVDQIIHEGDSNTYMQFHAADQWRVVTGGTERFEVNNSNVTVNKQLLLTAGTDAKLLASGQYGHTFMTFRNNTDTSSYGLIYHSGSSMVYGTSSDYRLKENVVPLEGASEKLKLIPVKSFNFIEDPNRTVDGFLAHELQEHIPEAVVGEKDGIDEDGNPEYQAVDQSKLTPLLTAALQEALAKIEELEQRIENLENN
jgi:hypothetical protein